MPPLTKILLPVDYSERCMAVAVQATVLAERFASEITALRVLAPPADVAPEERDTVEAFLETRRRAAAARLNHFVAAHLRRGTLAVNSILCEGDPASQILSHAAASGSDLIMMPTRGGNPFRLMLLGSVAARCLHASVCPIWMGPHRERPAISDRAAFGPIVCTVALGSTSSRGVEWAAGLAAALHSTLTVLHLAPRVDLPAEEGGHPSWRCHAFQEGAAAVPDVSRRGIKSRHILLETGDISKAVPEVAEQLNADLLVLDPVPWEEAHLSIDTYAIIRSSTCSILRL